MSTKQSQRTNNFNYRIARYFLNNHRLMILSLFFLTAVGVVSFFGLKTTGFPEPTVNVVLVQTIYPGASAETVTKDVTQPIEGVIKDIDGITTYQSRTTNGISLISVTTDENTEANTVRADIDAAIGTIELPENVETPVVQIAAFDNPDILFSIAGKNNKELYVAYEELEEALSGIPETAAVTPQVPIERLLVITLDVKKQTASGIDQQAVEQAIKSIGEAIPIAGNTTIDKKNTTITTTFPDATLTQVRRLVVGVDAQGEEVRLRDIANVSVEYQFEDNNTQYVGLRDGGDAVVLPAVTVQVTAANDTNIATYTAAVRDAIAGNRSVKMYDRNDEGIDRSQPLVIEQYTSDEANQDQVDEVVSGLIGGKLAIDSPVANIGWLLGGVQLVFLVMLAFVSWRAALVSTIAIPLSLIFSTIYLYAIGEDLNTLVLFSLVLVIGMVVDPTLVILESIQRKIDTGLSGKKAALAAVADVGPGLFLASLTNIIVFLPFGLISGILGQIFAYIPLTIIPAVVGSYIVPLIFLGWIGGLFLKKNKRSTENEEKNLWRIARWIIRLNNRLLEGSVIVRTIIIAIAFCIPVAVTGWYFGSEKIRVVQFAGSDNADFLQISGTFTNDTPEKTQDTLKKEVLTTALQNSAVEEIYPMTATGFQYMVNLSPAIERGEYKSAEINQNIAQMLQEKEIQPRFFDLTTDVVSIGPPAQSYQIALAVSGADTAVMNQAAVEVGNTMMQVCDENGVFRIDENCSGSRVFTKIDDGMTGQQNTVIEVVLNREKLLKQQLTVPNAPLSLLANQFIRSYFSAENSKSFATIRVGQDDADAVIFYDKKQPKTVKEIQNITLLETPLATIRVKDVATVKKTVSQNEITRTNGETISIVQGRIAPEYNNQATIGMIAQTVLEYYQKESGEQARALGLPEDGVNTYSEGDNAAAARSFQDLLITLVLAIVVSYIVLALFFKSFTSPLVILFSIPLSFLGIFPALAHLGNGQFGFLEIIGLIILIGIVENVAIFLIDAARQKIDEEGWDEKRAIAYASGVRLRPVILTKCTALASLAPLAILSETYRSISLVIMFGLLTSGLTSLFTTPILYIFFRWVSRHFYATPWFHKLFFFFFSPIYLLVWWYKDSR